MVALVNADLLKLRRKRGLWYTTLALGPVVVIVAGCLGAIVSSINIDGGKSFVQDSASIANFFLSIAAAVVGARLGADEHALNTFRYQVLSGRSRADLFASKVLALLVVVTLAAAAATVVSAVMSVVPPPNGQPSVDLQVIGVTFGQIWLPAAVYGIISLGVGSLVRSTGGAIALAVGLQLVGLNLLALLPLIWDGLKYAAMPVALSRITYATTDPGDDLYMAVLPAIACVVVWAAAFLLVGLVRTVRSED